MTLLQIIDAHNKPFKWGCGPAGNDCCKLLGAAVLERQNRDILKQFRGKYSTKVGAAKALRTYGKGTLLKTLGDLVGPPVHPSRAMTWDIVMLDRFTAGVCCGELSVFIFDAGIIHIPTIKCKWAFKNG